jgi:anti-anti-sigma factor
MNVVDLDEQGTAERLDEPDFRLTVRAGVDGLLVVPQGELDLLTAPQLEAVLLAHTGPVAVDLRKLSFVDPAGLRPLVEADARSRQDGKHLTFIAGPVVRHLFELAGMPDPLTYIAPPALAATRGRR